MSLLHFALMDLQKMDHFVNADSDKAYIRTRAKRFTKALLNHQVQNFNRFFLPQKPPPPRDYNYVSTQSSIVISKLWSEKFSFEQNSLMLVTQFDHSMRFFFLLQKPCLDRFLQKWAIFCRLDLLHVFELKRRARTPRYYIII